MTRRRRTQSLLPIIGAFAITHGISGAVSPSHAAPATIAAVGAENEYADVIAQVGGRYVKVSAIESNPGSDPHTFEASPSIAREIASAQLVVQNGLGYDSYMDNIESGSPSKTRTIIDVQKLLRLPDATANPHLWYKPRSATTARRLDAAVGRNQASWPRSDPRRPTDRAYVSAKSRPGSSGKERSRRAGTM